MDAIKFRDTLQASQRAHADLYSWGVVVTHLESSEQPSDVHYKTKEKVIAIAKAEIQKALKRMDAADSKLKAAAQRAAAQKGE